MMCDTKRVMQPNIPITWIAATVRRFPILTRSFSTLIMAALLAAPTAWAQLSPSAYRVLGQSDLHANGVNMVQGVELFNPVGLALDSRTGEIHVYISDTRNNRVLAWRSVSSYQIGDPPALVLAQPGPLFSGALGIGIKGLNAPLGLAVNPQNGDLYVADFGDNRVVRFRDPFSNLTRIEPDAVYGQSNFATRTAGATASTMNQPRAAAFDSSGNLWISDSGNHRILRFAAGVLDAPTPPAADTVVGQKDFVSNSANQASGVSATGFDTPVGITFDAQSNLYVADANNARVLRFAGPLSPNVVNPAANGVWGQGGFTTRTVPALASSTTLAGPNNIAVDSNSLYVAVPHDNRVLVFPLTPPTGSSARTVIGQTDFTTTAVNGNAFPQASPGSLSGPSDVKVDSSGNVYVADTNNNRVLQFPNGARSAFRVWGQTDFVSNGPNQIKPGSIGSPFHMAIDYTAAPFALYVSDSANHRVLIWKDSVRYLNGDPADLVIGQPNLRTAVANVDTQNTPSATSLFSPTGIAVEPGSGAVYVADSGNNRVLRYPRPVSQSGRITPDAVIGQNDFISSTSAAVSASSLNSPGGLAFGPSGELFVADSGNNRVLEFAGGARTGAQAIRVFGQPNMNTGLRPGLVSPQTLSSPLGLAVDSAGNLYVADSAANRVLIFSNTQNAPLAGASATFVIGQNNFSSISGSLKSPADVAIDSNGQIYVSDFGDNRVLIYSSLIFLPSAGATPSGFVGQQTVSGTAVNFDSTDGRATPEGLFGPVGVYLDRQDTLYVGDAGNNRVVQFLKAVIVVNAATFQSGVPVAPGSIVTLGGAGLSADTATASGTWPTALANRQVVVNDQLPAPIYYMAPGQTNFQVPGNAPLGTQRIAVRVADTGELVSGGSVLVAAAGPGLFTINQTGSGQGAVTNQDFSVNSSSNPALSGSTITLYGTGQGQVSPAVLDGQPAPSAPLSNTVAVPTSDAKTCQNNQPSVCVQVGTTFGNISYSGLAPGFIGLWQINVALPQGVTGSNVPVRVVINGTPSNTVSIAVR
jgi:uncharacterized protein (TIGR03437 family)